MEKQHKNTKTELINAFDKSEKKTIRDACRIADVTPTCFYFHFYKDADFRAAVEQKRKEILSDKSVTA